MDFKPACGSGEGEGESERFENSIRQTDSTIALPLTLTLSPGERGQPLSVRLNFEAFYALPPARGICGKMPLGTKRF